MKHLDKAHHVVWSFALAVAGAFLLGPIGGLVIAGVLGLVKEWWDGLPPRRRFDWWDMVANVVGILAAVFILKRWGV